VTASLGVGNVARFVVSPSDSRLAFEARSTLHPVHGKATQLDGFVELERGSDCSLAWETAPRMRVDFPVEQLRTGNAMQDREMWKVIDSKRFPRVTADLRELRALPTPGHYAASGDITLAGRTRRYAGELTCSATADSVTLEGELSVDIRDFGLKPPNLLIVKVDPVVRVRLHLVARSG